MTDGTMRCEEALRLLAEYLDGELEAGRAGAVRQHVHTCKSCYSRAEFEKRLKSKVSELRSCEIEPEFATRIRDLIHRFGNEPGADESAPH